MWPRAAKLSIGRVPDFMSSEHLQAQAGVRPNSCQAWAVQSQIAIACAWQAGNAVKTPPILHFVHITAWRGEKQDSPEGLPVYILQALPQV